MNIEGERNNLGIRVTILEREVERLKEGRPDVVADRVKRLAEEVSELRAHINRRFDDIAAEIEKGDKANRDDLEGQKRILIGAWVTIATGLILAYVLGSGGGVG